MYAVLYEFEVIKGKESIFIEAWKTLTQHVYETMGSLGSRLHSTEAGIYVAYAQWPSKELFEKNTTELPDEMIAVRETMRDACSHVGRLFEMTLTDDQLMENVYGESS